MHRVFLNLTDFFPSIEHVTKMCHRCTFIILLVSSSRLHVSFSQGFLQASQFAKSSRGKPPRSHSLSERERERESVCTMARATRLPRCPAAPLTQYPTSKGGKEKITRKTREDLGKGLLVVLLSAVGGHAGHHWGLPSFCVHLRVRKRETEFSSRCSACWTF